ncbi:hypothetical protein GPJ56_005205 [Histomonas meleagridis]|uniref:uncharacterized protein n=1 Tax=Histomonas meleagridis TaxID=135588 RepID=UPI0035598A04|nr:hypothetical protein GPJ56_005205 [Histomonas meleagridis]KAH0802721.1 hypothetical protein GO595_004770 [Histomonas meleagridis]
MKEVAALKELCPQLAASGVMLLLREINAPEETFLDLAEICIPKLQNEPFKQEISQMMSRIIGMTTSDCLLYFNALKGIILSSCTERSFPETFNQLVENMYDSLVFVCQITDKHESYKHERSLTTPETVFPDSFFPYIELYLELVYKLVEMQKNIDFSQLSIKMHSIFCDLLLQTPNIPNLVRYEGKIYSYLSSNSEWQSVILNRIQNLNGSKQSRKVLAPFLRNLKYLKVVDQETINQLTSADMKSLDYETQCEYVKFVSKTIVSSNIKSVSPKFYKFACQLCSSKQKKINFSALKAVFDIISVSTEKVKNEKISKLIKTLCKAEPRQFSKILVKAYRAICPSKIPTSFFIKELHQNIFKKSKLFIFPETYAEYLDGICDFYVSATSDDVKSVTPLLNGIATLAPQYVDNQTSLIFLIKMINKLYKTSKQLSSDLVDVISANIKTFYSTKATKQLLIEMMHLIPVLWIQLKDAPNTMLQMINEANNLQNIDVSIAAVKGYTELMKLNVVNEIPAELTMNIPINLTKQITNKIKHEQIVQILLSLIDFFKVLKESNGYKEINIDNLLLAVESKIFPFIFIKSKMMYTSLNELFTIFNELTNNYKLANYFIDQKTKQFSYYIQKNENWFIDIYVTSAQYWMTMDRFQDQEYTNTFLMALLQLARSNKDGQPIEITKSFLFAALEYMYRWKFNEIQKYIQMLDPSNWNILFQVYEELNTKYNGQPLQYFLYIQNSIITHRKFKDYKGEEDIFLPTIKNYLKGKRLRFERDIPLDKMSLNVCSTYIRVHPEKIDELAQLNDIIEFLMKKVNPKEIFVIDEVFLFASLDFFAAIIKHFPIKDERINEVVNYIIQFSEKSSVDSIIQYVITDCISNLFANNVNSRSIIIHSALSSRRSQILGNAILKSNVEFTRMELTQLFVLGMSIFNIEPSFGISVAKLLLKDKLEINPFSKYDIETEHKIWEQIEQNLSDEEVDVYFEMLERSVNSLQRSPKVPLFFSYFLEKNLNRSDFEPLFTIFSSSYKNVSNFLPLVKVFDNLFQNCSDSINEMFDFMFENDNNYQSTSFVSNIAFKSCPNEVSKYLKSKLKFLYTENPEEIWESFENECNISSIACLSMIFALQMDSLKYFDDILPQIILYSLYLQGKNVLKKNIPILTHTLIYQLEGTLSESMKSTFLSPEICRKVFELLKKSSVEKAELFEKLCMPTKISSICFYIIKSVSTLFSEKSLNSLINNAVNFVKHDNVSNLLQILPSIFIHLGSLDHQKAVLFMEFLLTFVYENRDQRLMLALANNLSILVKNKLGNLNGINNKVILYTALSSLLLVESSQSILYLSIIKFLKYMSNYSADKEVINSAALILEDLRSIHSNNNSITSLINEIKEKTQTQSRSDLLTFLVRLASSNIVNESNFRMNIVSYVCGLFDIVEEADKEIAPFLFISTFISDEELSIKYAKLLAKVILSHHDIDLEFMDVLFYMFPTIIFFDENTNEEFYVVSPEYLSVQTMKGLPKCKFDEL